MPTRRDLLAAAALLTPLQRLSAASGPDIPFPTAPRDRLAVASWSFHEHFERSKIDMKNFATMVADRYKIHNVELLGQHLPSTTPEYLKELRAAIHSAGSHVINVPAGGRASLYHPDTQQRAAAVANGKKWIDVAVALNSPSVRLNLAGVKGVTPDPVLAAEGLTTISQYGASKNVIVTLENDDPVSEEAFFIVKIIDRVNSPWLRALPDFCNSMLKGDEKFNYAAVQAMFQRAYNICHVKDSEVDDGKVFRIDLERTFSIAKASGFKGYYSVEFEGEGDAYAGVAKLVDAALKYI
jgi:sugar phosphate isomerase/epimerase